mmetsp:Transcript_103266/g.291605  ORF Transcript_103266/g.291605 Transcript_103266/m.291605 type:complete len:127 (+) Transcript_103266:128-508(+)|eukprot:CAMPEP_0117526010 /NCGR_PEP_ID=MMETSP0784-20121206/36066_1 /TAXON_ID=39447 /ORGANISM="" /LENGTH=126 /DNA_ID=CAMNT_0005322227 /DNA_START=112 /DNA_END=492 /DNA_ORIENTATION=-
MAPKEMINKLGEEGFDMETFKGLITGETDKRLHIVDVYTNWCGPCISMVPTFKNLQMNVDYFEDRCTISQVDRMLLPEYAERIPQTSKPHFLFYKFGQEAHFVEGLKAPEILNFINENLPPLEVEE